MATVTQDDVLSVLKRIAAPDGRGNVVSAGLVSDIAIQGGTVMFALTTTPAACAHHGESCAVPWRRRCSPFRAWRRRWWR